MLNIADKFNQWRRQSHYQKIVENADGAEVMRDYLSVPLIDKNTPANECDYLAVDIETTGLSNSKDSLLSVGFVPIIDQSIDLSHAKHFIIQSDALVGQSATIHGIHDNDILEQGVPVEEVMQILLSQLKGKVLLVHYARLDYGFLNKTSKELYNVPLYTQMIDTLEVEKKRQLRKSPNVKLSLRLDDCREQYGLPRYLAHNALIDAIATAELWLAQMDYLQEKENLSLKNF